MIFVYFGNNEFSINRSIENIIDESNKEVLKIALDKIDLVDGSATVNIDTVAGMTEGTFVLLCDDIQCFTSNESDWDAVKGSVSGNILTIECQNTSSTATIAWMVIGDRKDEHMKSEGTDWTDANGKPIIEPEKTSADTAIPPA